MQGTEVRIWREGDRVILEPISSGWEPLFAAIRALPDGFVIARDQPAMQERDWNQFDEIAEPKPVANKAKRHRK